MPEFFFSVEAKTPVITDWLLSGLVTIRWRTKKYLAWTTFDTPYRYDPFFGEHMELPREERIATDIHVNVVRKGLDASDPDGAREHETSDVVKITTEPLAPSQCGITILTKGAPPAFLRKLVKDLGDNYPRLQECEDYGRLLAIPKVPVPQAAKVAYIDAIHPDIQYLADKVLKAARAGRVPSQINPKWLLPQLSGWTSRLLERRIGDYLASQGILRGRGQFQRFVAHVLRNRERFHADGDLSRT